MEQEHPRPDGQHLYIVAQSRKWRRVKLRTAIVTHRGSVCVKWNKKTSSVFGVHMTQDTTRTRVVARSVAVVVSVAAWWWATVVVAVVLQEQ